MDQDKYFLVRVGDIPEPARVQVGMNMLGIAVGDTATIENGRTIVRGDYRHILNPDMELPVRAVRDDSPEWLAGCRAVAPITVTTRSELIGARGEL